MSSTESKMKTKVFERDGIVLSEVVYTPHNNDLGEVHVPEHVQNFIECLMEHGIRIPDDLRDLFQNEQQELLGSMDVDEYPAVLPPTTAFYRPEVVFNKPEAVLTGFLDGGKRLFGDENRKIASLALKAREYDAAKVPQETWEQFLMTNIFRTFEDSAKPVSRQSKLFDAWTLEQNISWDASSKFSPIAAKYQPPQPTFTYGFPVHVPEDPTKKPTGFNRDDRIASFSLNILADLGPIVACPSTHPLTLKENMASGGQKPGQRDLICFPWAVVQVQSVINDEVENCYFRAANAAIAALDMQRKLQPAWAEAKDIAPVIYFTCCGPKVRVWLSFLAAKVPKPSYKHICIWAGTLRATWGIIMLREIVRNMTFWASRVLKPQVASRISQIRSILSAPKTRTRQAGARPSPALKASYEPKTKDLGRGTYKSTNSSYVMYRGRSIRINLPKHDERKPGRLTAEDWNLKNELWSERRRSNTSGQTGSAAREKTEGDFKAADEISGTLHTLKLGTNENAERRRELDGKVGLEKKISDKDDGGLDTKKGPTLDAGTQGPADKSQNKPHAGASWDDELMDDDLIGKYFVYRTRESFHIRTYDATIWDSDGENDQSYVPSIASSDTDSEFFDVELEEEDDDDDADDEGSETDSSSEIFEDAVEEHLSGLKLDDSQVKNTGSTPLSPPGETFDLTLDDIDDLRYNAISVLDGKDFVKIKAIRTIINRLEGVELLDATWRALENWVGKTPELYSDEMKHLLFLIGGLNEAVVAELGHEPQGEEKHKFFDHHHLTMGLRNADLDHTLQKMQEKDESLLRFFFESTLESWNGEKCMEILSNELLELPEEEYDAMLEDALDVLYLGSKL